METDIPYMLSVTNLHKILDAIQKAGVPETFNLDFLKDLGFTSSNDRAIIKILKYLGMLDSSGRPQTSYREFVDHTKSKTVLASRLRVAFDDLYLADKEAHSKTVESLKGWFKTKTGAGDAVAQKIATTFKTLAQYADFSRTPEAIPLDKAKPSSEERPISPRPSAPPPTPAGFGLVYRFEIHLPDTQNVDTFRAIFRALREELIP